jgi:arsenate reductase
MNILFMCVANSARSQIAEGLAKAILGPGYGIQSAGSHPSKLNPFAVTVLEEDGIDLSGHYSKSVDELPPDFIAGLDYVVTLCAEEVCPTLVSKAKRLHWPHPDPAVAGESREMQLERFRRARNDIRAKIEAFRVELDSVSDPVPSQSI